MTERQDWDLAFDPATGLRRRQEDETSGRILPSDRWPNFFSRVVAKLQWDEAALDLVPDAKAYREMPDERRDRLTNDARDGVSAVRARGCDGHARWAGRDA